MKNLLFFYRERGFSLIELMVVIGIIGILATIAIPFYQNYTHKAQFTEIVQAVAPFKLGVEACGHEQGTLQACVNTESGGAQNGIPLAIHNTAMLNSYVKSVSVSAGSTAKVSIIAASQHIGKSTDSYTYILDGVMQPTGQIIWTRNAKSTCASAGLC